MKICDYCKKEIKEIKSNGQKYHKSCFTKNRFFYQKKYREQNKKYFRKKDKERYKKFPERLFARNKARVVLKKKNCKKCNATKNLEKHHPDYSKPLFIITICKSCHNKIHKK